MHCFASVFTKFSLQKHVLLIHFTCVTRLHMYRTLYIKCTVLLVFLLSFHWRNMYFCYISHVHKITHVRYFIHEMHCFVSVFMCFHCRNIYFSYISHAHKNTHEPYFIHEMHCFASVFMCFHLVFTAETCTFGTFNMNTRIHMYHKFYTWNALIF
jgi:hypothetical protein